jgi:hypothetical protein
MEEELWKLKDHKTPLFTKLKEHFNFKSKKELFDFLHLQVQEKRERNHSFKGKENILKAFFR